MCALHDFKCMLLSVILQDVESAVPGIETKGKFANLKAFS